MNASSKEERDSWIEAIRQAIPRTKTSPSQPKKELPKNKVKELPLPHPKYTPRQDTANAAAILAAEDEIEKVCACVCECCVHVCVCVSAVCVYLALSE